MKKIPTVFIRDYLTGLVTPEVTPGCEWWTTGVATRKFDGTSCLVLDGKLYKRYDAKKGRKPPQGFLPAQETPDPVTGHFPGWLLVGEGPEDRWHREAMQHRLGASTEDGTYELIGVKVQGNPEAEYVRENSPEPHILVPHGLFWYADCPRGYEGLKKWLAERDIEGLVFYDLPARSWASQSLEEIQDCRMAKIKKKDFGLDRKLTA